MAALNTPFSNGGTSRYDNPIRSSEQYCDKNRFIPSKIIVYFTVKLNDYTKGHMSTTNLKSHTPISASILFLILFSTAINAQIPAGYYDPAAGKTGITLKAALHDIIKEHTEFPYTSSSTDVWDILKETDRDPNNSANVILLYTGRSVNGAQEYNNGNGWTREHVWAKSRGNFGTEPGAGTDVHHLRPCDNSTNTYRNNRWFDHSTSPHYDDGVATGNYFSDSKWTWEPRDAIKGDVARMIFYMAARYEGGSDEPDLEVVDYFPDKYSNEPFHAKLAALYQWHLDDPVDDWERNRNNIIYNDYQHNRNPFIDHPEFVNRIWDDTTSTQDTINLFFSEYIEGSGDNKALEIFNGTENDVDLSRIFIVSNFNGGIWSAKYSFPPGARLESDSVWVIVNSNANQSILNIADESTGSGVVNFNGNDVRALVKITDIDTIFLDVIGLYNGIDPGNGWNVAGINEATQNHTLIRKSSINIGNPDWTASAGTNTDDSEWIVYNSDTFEYLGSHTTIHSSQFELCNASGQPDDYNLYPCYPNPFNPATTIRYDLHKAATVTLYVYDLRGSLVNTLVRKKQLPGNYSVIWNGKDDYRRNVSAGVYLYRMQTNDGFTKTGKMILLK